MSFVAAALTQRNVGGAKATNRIANALHNRHYITYLRVSFSCGSKILRDGGSNPGLLRDRQGY